MWIKVKVNFADLENWLVSATLHEDIQASADNSSNWYSVYTPRWTCTIFAIFSYNPELRHVALDYVAYDEEEANDIFRQFIRKHDNVNLKVTMVSLDLPDTDIDTDSFS